MFYNPSPFLNNIYEAASYIVIFFVSDDKQLIFLGLLGTLLYILTFTQLLNR